jgi:hypothetical protein
MAATNLKRYQTLVNSIRDAVAHEDIADALMNEYQSHFDHGGLSEAWQYMSLLDAYDKHRTAATRFWIAARRACDLYEMRGGGLVDFQSVVRDVRADSDSMKRRCEWIKSQSIVAA